MQVFKRQTHTHTQLARQTTVERVNSVAMTRRNAITPNAPVTMPFLPAFSSALMSISEECANIKQEMNIKQIVTMMKDNKKDSRV